MILVDERTGSRELLQSIRNFGCDAELTKLDAADFAFSGCGPEGDVYVGVERKTISDLVQSMRSRRLAGFQHVQMSRIYDECYLFVEGLWRRGRDTGLLEVRNSTWHVLRGNIRYAEADRFLCSLQHQGGIHIWRTADEEETAAAVSDRYLWWQKPWHEHTAMQSLYAPQFEPKREGHKPRRQSTLLENIAAQLPGIDSKADRVAAHFTSVREMVQADEKEWMKVEGVGKVGAKKIVEAIHGTSIS